MVVVGVILTYKAWGRKQQVVGDQQSVGSPFFADTGIYDDTLVRLFSEFDLRR